MITAYILEDETVAHPSEVGTDETGALRHKDGLAVAMAPHGPRARGASDEELAADAKARAKQADDKTTRDMKPTRPKAGYKTKGA